MTQLGPVGVEEVTKHVNGYFHKLIEKIYEHSGDILKFAVGCNWYVTDTFKGDALLVMFEGDADHTLRAVQRYCSCCCTK